MKLEELKKALKKCQKEKAEYLAGWQRSRADFINFKREEGERFKKFFEVEKTEMILKILPILDNLQKATNYSEGLFQIEKQFQKFLKEEGIEEIKTEGEKFDPNFHEAVKEVEAGDKEPGTIVEVLEKGYLIKGQVLRPAKVKVVK